LGEILVVTLEWDFQHHCTNLLHPLLVDLFIFHFHIVFLIILINSFHYIWKNKQKNLCCLLSFWSIKNKVHCWSVLFDILANVWIWFVLHGYLVFEFSFWSLQRKISLLPPIVRINWIQQVQYHFFIALVGSRVSTIKI